MAAWAFAQRRRLTRSAACPWRLGARPCDSQRREGGRWQWRGPAATGYGTHWTGVARGWRCGGPSFRERRRIDVAAHRGAWQATGQTVACSSEESTELPGHHGTLLERIAGKASS